MQINLPSSFISSLDVAITDIDKSTVSKSLEERPSNVPKVTFVLTLKYKDFVIFYLAYCEKCETMRTNAHEIFYLLNLKCDLIDIDDSLFVHIFPIAL